MHVLCHVIKRITIGVPTLLNLLRRWNTQASHFNAFLQLVLQIKKTNIITHVRSSLYRTWIRHTDGVRLCRFRPDPSLGHNLKTTLYQRWSDFMMSHRRWFDVVLTQCTCGDKVWMYMKVSKGAKFRSRYNQVPHRTQDVNGKVTNSQLDTTNESQEVSPFPAGDHKSTFKQTRTKT